jgi:hypothetical protein
VKVMPVRTFTRAQCSRSGAKRFPTPGRECRQPPRHYVTSDPALRFARSCAIGFGPRSVIAA